MSLRDYFLEHFYSYLKQSFPFISFIIIIDMLPLLALIFWDWSAIEALYLYTLETIILLWFALRKMRRSKYIFAIFPDHLENVVTSLDKSTKVNLRAKIPGVSLVKKGARGLLFLVFTLVWIPLILLQMMIISSISGDGFRLFGFAHHDSGQLDLGIISLDLMIVFLILLYFEHSQAYKRKFIGKREYEDTGLINEGLIFSVRVFIQQFFIIGLFALIGFMHLDNASMIFIIVLKTLMDIISYIFNRVWGGIKNKKEGKD